MGERIERLQMRAFRGVPDELLIDLGDGRSLLVFGDNATGKSTIADAVEWYLTGRIDYLSRENRGQGLRNAASRPDQETSVTVQMDGELGGDVSQDADPPAEVLATAEREYYLLRGRDVSSFVEKTKREKWGALAGILGLEPAEKFRAGAHLLAQVGGGGEDRLLVGLCKVGHPDRLGAFPQVVFGSLMGVA